MTEIADASQPAVPTAIPFRYDLQPFIQRYLDGESVQVLAKECGITPQAMYRRFKFWMLRGRMGDMTYKQLVAEAMSNKQADADWQLESAVDAVGIARARELCRFTRMDFERVFPELYGQKQEITEDKTIRVIIQRDTKKEPEVVNVRTNNDTMGHRASD